MKEFTKAERQVTLAGVMIVFLLAALDQTIVSTAMPRIVAELNGLSLYAWVTTAYLLTSTVMIPIWGKLGDLYGRKPVLLGSIGFFLAGSWLSGLAGEIGDLPLLGGGMTQLIAFRALQGVGGGGLFSTSFTILGDLYSPRERAKVGAMFGALFAVASTVGPLVGGYFTDHGTATVAGQVVEGWRWVFYLNLPLSLISLFMILFMMPRMSHEAKGKVDVLGAALIVMIVVPLLLALTFGGHTYAWTSPMVLELFTASAVGLVAYVVAERFAPDPILPLGLFRNRVFWTSNLAGFLMSMAFMSTVAFLPLFMQLGQGVEATTSGLSTLPLMFGMMISGIICGRLVMKTGRYKPFMLIGVALTFLGIFLLSRMTAATGRLDLAWRMAVLGIGLGPGQNLFNLATQNAMPQSQLGVVTSSGQFFRQIGSAIGVALFGAFLTTRLNEGFGKIMPGVDIGKLQGMGEHAAGAVAPVLPAFAREIIAGAITNTFGLGLLVTVAAGLIVLLIPQVPMADRRPEAQPAADPEIAEAAAPT